MTDREERITEMSCEQKTMLSFDIVRRLWPWAKEEEYIRHPNGGGWKHKGSTVPDSIWVPEDAIIGDGASIGPPRGHRFAALRSGKYRQGRERLRSIDDTFCCLGVLCDLHAKATGGGSAWVRYEDDPSQYYLDNALVLPPAVAEWAFGDSADRDPIVPANGNDYTISGHNDDGLTFAQLADIIEAQL